MGRKGNFSRRSNSRSSTVRELKSVHVTRATHVYQNQGVSSKLQEVGNFPTQVFSSLMVI